MVSLILGFVCAFLVAAVPGKSAIRMLRRLNARQNISEDAPTTHLKKQGTPTMGGLLILCALTVTVLLYFLTTQFGAHRHPQEDYTLLPLLLLTLGFGGIGFADDYLSAKRGKNLGLRAREKLLGQFLIGAGFVIWMYLTARPGYTTMVEIAPASLLPSQATDLGIWYYPLALLLITSFSNATNLTDGLDGLSSGVAILISVAVGILVATIHPELGLFCFALAGALAGFLWWNAHPARVFMGDTCSLALGAGLAGAAMLGKQEVGLLVASLVCWAELISVIIQVSVFQFYKRNKRYGETPEQRTQYADTHRIFRKTPLHHHFEMLGWEETQVVTRFWIVGAICGLLALLWNRS